MQIDTQGRVMETETSLMNINEHPFLLNTNIFKYYLNRTYTLYGLCLFIQLCLQGAIEYYTTARQMAQDRRHFHLPHSLTLFFPLAPQKNRKLALLKNLIIFHQTITKKVWGKDNYSLSILSPLVYSRSTRNKK